MKTNLLRKSIAPLIIISGFFISSCGSKTEKNSEPKEKISATVAYSELKSYPVVHSFSGKLQADKQSNLSTRIMGQVNGIYVKPGQSVRKGDLLLQIRNQDILAKKAQVEANKTEATTAFESAQKDLNRFEALYKTKSASEKEMDDIRTQFQVSKARLDAVLQMEKEVEESLRYSSIRAPYNGTITGKFVQEGDMASPGMPLLSIESPAQWKVYARVPEADIANFQLNDSVKVEIKAINKTINGTIAEINPSLANTGNQFEVKILLDTENKNTQSLYSGMYADVYYEHGTEPLILIPKGALVHRGQLVGLYALSQNQTALLRWVKTGKTYGNSIQILSGLSDGEQYIVSGEGKLYDGVSIQIN